MLKAILLIIKIIFLALRLILFLRMGIAFLWGAPGHEEQGYVLVCISLALAIFILVSTFFTLLSPNRKAWMIYVGLLLADAIIFYLLVSFFPYGDQYMINVFIGFALLAVFSAISIAAGHIFLNKSRGAENT